MDSGSSIAKTHNLTITAYTSPERFTFMFGSEYVWHDSKCILGHSKRRNPENPQY